MEQRAIFYFEASSYYSPVPKLNILVLGVFKQDIGYWRKDIEQLRSINPPIS